MSAAAPWSVKGIDPKAREIAKDLARRSGMTLGEWLNTMIMDDDDDGVTPLPRRAQFNDGIDRRGRSRRLDDAYYSDDSIHRIGASVEAIAARLEASERRATLAVQGIDQAVAGLVRRLDDQDEQTSGAARRLDDISEELKEGHRRLRKFEHESGPQTAESLKKIEASIGTIASRLYDIEERQRLAGVELRHRMDAVEKTATVFSPAELDRRIDERGHAAGVEARLRLDSVEKAVAAVNPTEIDRRIHAAAISSAEIDRRIEAAAGRQTGSYAQFSQRLDAAQAQTTEALRSLERSFADLDQRVRLNESRSDPEASRFEKLAEGLARQVADNRAEMIRKLEAAESEGRLGRIEQIVSGFTDQVRASEERGARALESMGRVVLRVAENLGGRMKTVEAASVDGVDRLGRQLNAKIEQDLERHAQAVEQRMVRADDQQALAIEKLGTEITRISDRLTERINQSERRSAQALEDIGRRLAESAERTEQRYDRASGELAERMRQSEERTAKLLSDARESISMRSPADIAYEADWRSAAFAEPKFDADWQEPAREVAGVSPFPGSAPSAFSREENTLQGQPEVVIQHQASPAPADEIVDEIANEVEDLFEQPEALDSPREPVSGLFGGGASSFGGADVSDVIEAIQEQEGESAAADLGAAPTGSIEDEILVRQALADAASRARAASTRDTLQAARSAMEASAEPIRPNFGGRPTRGGKSKLQERMDRRSANDGGPIRKAMPFVAAAVTLGALGAAGYAQHTGRVDFTQLLNGDVGTPIAALAVADAPAPAVSSQGEAIYLAAINKLDAEDVSGLEGLRQAANLGHPAAQQRLALLYQDGGAGLTASPVEARTWFERSARGGNVDAMDSLAHYLFDGLGGTRDQVQAADWFGQAARRGDTDSQFNFARLQERGAEGVPVNLVEAYKWYLIAAAGGDQEAGQAASGLEARLSDSQREGAQGQAAAFSPDPGAQSAG